MAAPVQRGTAHATFPAPTSTIFTIDGNTFKVTPTADHESIKNEAGEDILEVFNNPGHHVSFTGTVKSAQTPKAIGDVLTLTYPTGHPLVGAVTYVITAAPQEGSGKVTRQNVEAKRNDAAGVYS